MVNLYSKPGCGQCVATKLKLNSMGVDYNYIDVTKDEEAFNHVVETLGYMQMPVVETEDDHWSGFNPDKLSTLDKAAA